MLAHGYQNLENTRCLSKFNYGIAGNQQHYGQDSSPCYDMTKITNRFIGKNYIVTPYSENTLSRFGVNPVFEKYVIPYAGWNRGDFIYAKTGTSRPMSGRSHPSDKFDWLSQPF
ncbi:hypothetical protein HDE_00590 [Halotydeus destructor]|nr:hypothetical protein HDE_00590 [Halotydeus destructor]